MPSGWQGSKTSSPKAPLESPSYPGLPNLALSQLPSRETINSSSLTLNIPVLCEEPRLLAPPLIPFLGLRDSHFKSKYQLYCKLASQPCLQSLRRKSTPHKQGLRNHPELLEIALPWLQRPPMTALSARPYRPPGFHGFHSVQGRTDLHLGSPGDLIIPYVHSFELFSACQELHSHEGHFMALDRYPTFLERKPNSSWVRRTHVTGSAASYKISIQLNYTKRIWGRCLCIACAYRRSTSGSCSKLMYWFARKRSLYPVYAAAGTALGGSRLWLLARSGRDCVCMTM